MAELDLFVSERTDGPRLRRILWPEMEWRISSPSAVPLSCEIDETPDGFVLRVMRAGGVLFVSHSPDPEPLRALAALWRQSLEARGYRPLPDEPSPPDD